MIERGGYRRRPQAATGDLTSFTDAEEQAAIAQMTALSGIASVGAVTRVVDQNAANRGKRLCGNLYLVVGPPMNGTQRKQTDGPLS